MPPLPDNVHRGRCLLLFTGLYAIPFVVGMMVIGSLNLVDPALRWVRISFGIVCFLAAYGYLQAAVRRGKPGWLFKSPPSGGAP